jgi:RNA polymerase sigma-70 factor (ECF subfamily)
MSKTESIEALVARAQAGDRNAFGDLSVVLQGPLLAIVRSRMGEEARGYVEPEDIVQETLTRALGALESFRWEGEGSFLRWLAGIARNLILKAVERGRRARCLEVPSDSGDASASPSRVLRRKERLERLERALQALPPDHREVIRLARIEGLKHTEIAERMGRSHAAVRQMLVRALRRLRESFGETDSLHLPDRRLEDDGEERKG